MKKLLFVCSILGIVLTSCNNNTHRVSPLQLENDSLKQELMVYKAKYSTDSTRAELYSDECTAWKKLCHKIYSKDPSFWINTVEKYPEWKKLDLIRVGYWEDFYQIQEDEIR